MNKTYVIYDVKNREYCTNTWDYDTAWSMNIDDACKFDTIEEAEDKIMRNGHFTDDLTRNNYLEIKTMYM